jgi:hypothetical protein
LTMDDCGLKRPQSYRESGRTGEREVGMRLLMGSDPIYCADLAFGANLSQPNFKRAMI